MKLSVTKFLGLTIETELNWNEHIEILNKNLCCLTYGLFMLAPQFSLESLLTAYYSIVENHLRYSVTFWSNSSHKQLAFKAQA